jgi:hypothetical protein
VLPYASPHLVEPTSALFVRAIAERGYEVRVEDILTGAETRVDHVVLPSALARPDVAGALMHP